MKQQGEVTRAIGFGTSQSGRFLRSFLYTGFNADEHGKKVFDGVWAHVAGAGKGSFDHRFAQPSRDGHPLLNLFYPTDMFPFTDEPETEDGMTDAVLARAKKDNVVPKIFYTNGSYEYWGRAASLIHISPDAKKDVAPPPTTRIYYLAGTQHGANAQPIQSAGQNRANPTDYRFAMRALLVAMNDWITDGTAPPESQIPRINKDQLVARSELAFTKIPGISTPKEYYLAWHLDFGPDFKSKGIVAYDPPKVGKAYSLLVPQVDPDGNETSGVRLPEQIVSCRLPAYTGWNPRDPGRLARHDLQHDGFLHPLRAYSRPSASNKVTRARRSKNAIAAVRIIWREVSAAAQVLVKQHLLLERDIAPIKEKAGARWDSLMTTASR